MPILVWMFLILLSNHVKSVSSEIILEIEFDIHPTQNISTGYSASHALHEFMSSKNMKYLRYFHHLVSSKPGPVRMRTAHFAFSDDASVMQFVQEFKDILGLLFDRFWVHNHRFLWQTADLEAVPFPRRGREINEKGGYLFQMLYTPYKDQEMFNAWDKECVRFADELYDNADFLERTHYFADNDSSSKYRHMVQYEFTSLTGLTKTMFGTAFTELIQNMNKHIREYAVNILIPGIDEGLYWPAVGGSVDDEEAKYMFDDSGKMVVEEEEGLVQGSEVKLPAASRVVDL